MGVSHTTNRLSGKLRTGTGSNNWPRCTGRPQRRSQQPLRQVYYLKNQSLSQMNCMAIYDLFFFRSGCIQPGDRILRINQQSTAGLNLDQVIELMRESKPRMTLDVEFDVADAVVPASGIYWLKLVKPGGSSSNFGITLQGDASLSEIESSSRLTCFI